MKLNGIKLLIVSIVMIGLFVLQTPRAVQAYSENVTDVENNKLEDIVYDKIGLVSFDYELIHSFNEQNRYFLVEGNNCYLIYDRVLEDYIEFSVSSNSLYNGLNYGKIYLCPGYYFYNDGSEIIDIATGEIISEETVEKYIAFDNKLRTSFVANKNLSSQANETNSNSRSSELPSSKYIDNSFYIDKLIYNLGDNNDTYSNSCGFVALEIILSYYDTFLNDNVIPDTYDVEVSHEFSSYDSISLESYTSSPGVDNNFHAYLIQLALDNGYVEEDDYGLNIDYYADIVNDYFDEIGLNVTTNETTSLLEKINFIKQAINSDFPVKVSIRGNDTSNSLGDLSHAVVAYGYDESGIYAHFGWKMSYTINFNINNYAFEHVFYFQVNESHVCSDNYQWQANGCTGTVCPCGIKTCNHESLNYTYNTSSQHVVSCNACDYSYTENHDDLVYESINSVQHKVTCNTCDDYYLDAHDYVVSGDIKTCVDCGHQEEICYHENLSYENNTSTYHNVTCSDCGYSYTEEHDIYVENHTQYCSKCDYEYVVSIGHNYVYIPIAGGVSHRKQCLCGVSSVEACISLGQVGSTTKTCALCGQTMSGNIGFIPVRKEEDEEIE